ncbi:hypothetical protein HC891_20925, partial [Candidatus Gracilibacteria bacterium]|nr:hypothetical protein [Candidatus Gracilibacteria bacterium]
MSAAQGAQHSAFAPPLLKTVMRRCAPLTTAALAVQRAEWPSVDQPPTTDERAQYNRLRPIAAATAASRLTVADPAFQQLVGAGQAIQRAELPSAAPPRAASPRFLFGRRACKRYVFHALSADGDVLDASAISRARTS